jgi:hypothetical protein
MVILIARETFQPTIRPFVVMFTSLLLMLLLLTTATTATAQDVFQRASFGNPQTVRLNLTLSTVNATDNFGQTPLMYAASNNPDPEVISVLVQTGADVNVRTAEGWTALMYAARDNANPAVTTRLLQLGADPTLVNNDGFTAEDYAIGNTSLRDVPMTTPIEMPMPDPASIANPAAFMRPNRVPFVAAPYQSPFDGVSPEFIVAGEFGAFAPNQLYQNQRYQRPITAPAVTPSVTLMPPPTTATAPYYPPAVAATPAPSAMPRQAMPRQMMPNQQGMPSRVVANPFAPTQAVPRTPFMPTSFMPTAPRYTPGFEGVSPEFIVPGEFGMGFMPPALGQVNAPVNVRQGGTLPPPSFVTPPARFSSPIALSNAPVRPGRYAPNVPSYAGGSAATITNRSAIGAGYEQVPLRYSSSLLPDSARVLYGNVRYNPFLPLRTCDEFATQVSAQAFFVAAGGSLIDRHGLDADGNGIACENLP